MQEALRTIAARSSTRKYTDEKLTKEELNLLIDAALQAPTATNRQEIHVTVVDGTNPILAEIECEMRGCTADQLPAQNFYYGAPTLLMLSGEKAFSWTPVDAGIAVENIAIAAEAIGLGSVIIGCIKKAMNGEKQESFSGRLKFPEGYSFDVGIAVGYKADDKTPHTYSKEKSVTIID